jgi:hypothetical protein
VTPQDVLLAHQRTASGGCSCEDTGRKPELLGQSHTQHQVDELRAAGFAIVRDYTVAATVPAHDTPERCGWHRGVYTCHRDKGHDGEHRDPVRNVSWGDT